MNNLKDVPNYQSPMNSDCGINQLTESCADIFEHPHGFFLPHKFTQNLHLQIMDGLYDLEPGSTDYLKNICGKDFWKSLTKQERRTAYNCVDFLIEYEGLPLELEGYNGKKGYLFRHLDLCNSN